MTDEIAQTLQARYAIDEAGEARLLDSLPFDNPVPNQPETSVSVAQIRSLVCKGKGSMPGTSYLVPGFAVHWGLVIRHSIFHLAISINGSSIEIDSSVLLTHVHNKSSAALHRSRDFEFAVDHSLNSGYMGTAVTMSCTLTPSRTRIPFSEATRLYEIPERAFPGSSGFSAYSL
jgi:hypothetical protein